MQPLYKELNKQLEDCHVFDPLFVENEILEEFQDWYSSTTFELWTSCSVWIYSLGPYEGQNCIEDIVSAMIKSLPKKAAEENFEI